MAFFTLPLLTLASFKAKDVALIDMHVIFFKIGILALDQERARFIVSKIVSMYDQEIPQSQTADKPMASYERATQQS